ncbi:MAG: hypothetical protein KC478_11300 [Bacteriovoracaceae bacterium]|nr:hypothetical protein [Bacteriovoracaceae bacterium]
MKSRVLIILSLICLELFAGNCKVRLEKAIKNVAELDAVKLHGLSKQHRHYLETIALASPNVKREIIQDRESAKERLSRMYKNSTTADIEYQLQNKLLKADFEGGEGAIFIHPKNKKLALKVWTDQRVDQFELSTKALLVFEDRVIHDNKLKNYLAVTKIKEKGRNFIVREFAPRSRELKEVANREDVKKSIKALKRELSKSSDAINQKLMNALNRKPISANLHWDPDQGKILLIDALGF